MRLLLEAILEAGLAWRPDRELAAPWGFIGSRETSVRVVGSQSCHPKGGLIQGLPPASKNLQSHLWMGESILRQRQLSKDGNGSWFGTGAALGAAQ